MSYGVESTSTTRGTLIDYEIHKSPTGVGGVVAHWGERIPDDELKERIGEIYPGVPLEDHTGFDMIYHQPQGTSRSEGMADELEVGEFIGRQAMAVNGWEAQDIAGIFVGSGVPVADDPRYKDYSQVLAERLGLNPDVVRHTTYAACASGGHELLNALQNPDIQGKPVLVMGMEGITYLTEDFDPHYADALSMRFFSNGAAALGLVPGEQMMLLHSGHKVVEDTKGTLTAHMTYQDQMDPNGPVWQESNGVSKIIYPTPPDGKRITMQGPRTGLYFINNSVNFLSDLQKGFQDKYPTLKPSFGAAHHPSLTVHEHLGKKLTGEGISIEIPWVVKDGNSSAATSLIAEIRLLEDRVKDGVVQLFTAYGAGGSFDAGYILHSDTTHSLTP